MRLQRIDRNKIPKESPIPPIVQPTQTIIINNPNININYLSDTARSNINHYNGPFSSRGMDNWNLNQNLKEFSQTRQLGFFKNKKEKHKSNSPYVIHKVRTQDIKSINKIYATNRTHSNLNETLCKFNKNQTISHLPETSSIEKQQAPKIYPLPLEKLISKHEKTITQKFYKPQIKKIKHDLEKQYETLPTKHLQSLNPQSVPSVTKPLRRGRFQPMSDVVVIPFQSHSYRQEQLLSRQKYEQEHQFFLGQQQSEKRIEKTMAPRLIPFQMRKRALNKTIANIDKALLSQTDDYFQKIHGQQISHTKIQLFVNSVNLPQHISSNKINQPAINDKEIGEYDFTFEGERKKRPKTPKKKKDANIE